VVVEQPPAGAQRTGGGVSRTAILVVVCLLCVVAAAIAIPLAVMGAATPSPPPSPPAPPVSPPAAPPAAPPPPFSPGDWDPALNSMLYSVEEGDSNGTSAPWTFTAGQIPANTDSEIWFYSGAGPGGNNIVQNQDLMWFAKTDPEETCVEAKGNSTDGPKVTDYEFLEDAYSYSVPSPAGSEQRGSLIVFAANGHYHTFVHIAAPGVYALCWSPFSYGTRLTHRINRVTLTVVQSNL
jgi:hypothetical protein